MLRRHHWVDLLPKYMLINWLLEIGLFLTKKNITIRDLFVVKRDVFMPRFTTQISRITTSTILVIP